MILILIVIVGVIATCIIIIHLVWKFVLDLRGLTPCKALDKALVGPFGSSRAL